MHGLLGEGCKSALSLSDVEHLLLRVAQLQMVMKEITIKSSSLSTGVALCSVLSFRSYKKKLNATIIFQLLSCQNTFLGLWLKVT